MLAIKSKKIEEKNVIIRQQRNVAGESCSHSWPGCEKGHPGRLPQEFIRQGLRPKLETGQRVVNSPTPSSASEVWAAPRLGLDVVCGEHHGADKGPGPHVRSLRVVRSSTVATFCVLPVQDLNRHFKASSLASQVAFSPTVEYVPGLGALGARSGGTSSCNKVPLSEAGGKPGRGSNSQVKK